MLHNVRIVSAVTHTCVFATIHILSHFYDHQLIGLRKLCLNQSVAQHMPCSFTQMYTCNDLGIMI